MKLRNFEVESFVNSDEVECKIYTKGKDILIRKYEIGDNKKYVSVKLFKDNELVCFKNYGYKNNEDLISYLEGVRTTFVLLENY